MSTPTRSRDSAAPTADSRDSRSVPYAPFPLRADPALLGLTTRRVITRLGPLAVRTSPSRTGTTATVLLHGAAGSWSTWTPLLEAARSRGAEVGDLVLVDLPGWGGAPLPDRPLRNGRDSRTTDAYARAVADAVRSLGYLEWNLVGHSLGGFLALHLASIEPVRTRSVGLVSPTTFSVMAAAAHPLRRFASLPAYSALLAVMAMFAPFGGAASVLLAALNRARLLRAVVSPLFAHPSLVPRSILDALAAEVRPEAFVIASRQAGAYEAVEHWRRITCPVRSVRGEHDAFVTVEDDRMLGTIIRGASTAVLTTAGHFGHIEAPYSVLDALADSFSPRS
ncbi:alpha/beta hydrolase [Herbiconiux sp. CPCC 205763]|uniref:Alpha/beta hydrolase n=1 Tax=Herbiconiux aconitum TaxID=2970913 RepID=A0ABT2GUF7_9MICO|nr:alpha/beta hydrolase [Herbiconiux aconitum]MCS5719830.1 alpha/beta hydrolase [Herbiconiux aconitum]